MPKQFPGLDSTLLVHILRHLTVTARISRPLTIDILVAGWESLEADAV